MHTEHLTLITGANGKTGRRVTDRLTAAGHTVRKGSRSGTPAFDWLDVETWSAALEGVTQVYITFQPDLAYPGAKDIIERFCALAVSYGVERLVLLSGRGEPAAQACERVVQRSGARWCIVRASWFMENFSEGHFLGPVRSGTLALPVAAEVKEPFVSVDDIADIVAAALTGDRHDGALYEVTGTRLVTFTEAMAEISEAAGRDIGYAQIPEAVFQQGMIASGAPAPLAEFLCELFGMVLDGRNAHLTDGVQRALGRPARDFIDFAREAGDAWRVS
ncbi:MAG: NAD(P)H-binding protein [Bradymonadia bacterium]